MSLKTISLSILVLSLAACNNPTPPPASSEPAKPAASAPAQPDAATPAQPVAPAQPAPAQPAAPENTEKKP